MVTIRSTWPLFIVFAVASGQHAGTLVPEIHPRFPSQLCAQGSGCRTLNTSVTIDANWRWLHDAGGITNCFTGNTWDAAECPDPLTCAQNCALEGVNYTSTYGITTSGNSLKLPLVFSTNVGARVYLMADDTHYQIFQPLNQEIVFDVDVSNLPCGVNGALYLTSMDADGGLAKYPLNKAGAKYGTGYCDSKCPKDIKFINGQANLEGWMPISAQSGEGIWGSCCTELDIWEANSASTALTAHPCTNNTQTRCSGGDCTAGTGVCDAAGCDFNAYRLGAETFFGVGQAVDTSKVFTVITQFITSDNTSTGALTEIRRLYVQEGKVVQNAAVAIPGISPTNSVTDAFCTQEKASFSETDFFAPHGGLAQIGEALRTGMVLAFAIRDDPTANLAWLDSDYPASADAASPGVARGSCPVTAGVPAHVESLQPSPHVVFSNIKFGNIGTTSGFLPA